MCWSMCWRYLSGRYGDDLIISALPMEVKGGDVGIRKERKTYARTWKNEDSRCPTGL